MKLALASLFLLFPVFSMAQPTNTEIPVRREYPLNDKVNPCTDFHKHVCSQVEDNFKMRADRSRHLFAFSDSRERLLKIQMDYTKKLPQEKNLDIRTTQVKNYYMACMNAQAKANAERTEIKKLADLLNKITTTDELLDLLNTHQSKGGLSFISLWPDSDPDYPKKIIGNLYINFMNLRDHQYYTNDKLLGEYKKLIESVLKALYPKASSKDISSRAQNLVDLEKTFIEIYPNAATRQQRWSENRKLSQEKALGLYPNLKLDLILKNVPKGAEINISIPETFAFLNEKIKTLPLQTWKDRYALSEADDIMDDAYPQFFQALFNFEHKYFGGAEKRSSRQERCTSLTYAAFAKEIDTVLIPQIFPNFDEKPVIQAGEKIREAIVNGLKDNTWLSSAAKKEAIRKISTAKLQLVMPKNEKEWDYLPEKNYSRINAIENQKTLRSAYWERTLKRLREPANPAIWAMSPLTVNAYYSASENKFVMPIGILQYPFYDSQGSLIENLGAVGAVIGHELGHSVDDGGSKYNADGKLKQWMSTKDIMEFNKRGLKMVEQFNAIDHDGKLTLGENVADLVGLTFAYKAAFPKNTGSLEDKKKFFTSYARLWCEAIRPDQAKLLRKTDPHASGKARINEQIKHQPEFAKTFECKEGDPMVLPKNEIIQIW